MSEERSDSRAEVTQLLKQVGQGDRGALDRLLPLVYDELRVRAGAYMRGERRDHTLQPTALVHEAYLRMVNAKEISWQDRSHFLALAARNMRQVLANHARGKKADKRPPPELRVPLEADLAGTENQQLDLLAVHQALKRLESLQPRMAQVVEMRFFGGMSVEEVGHVLEVDARTVKRDWKAAKIFLLDELSGGDDSGSDDEAGG